MKQIESTGASVSFPASVWLACPDQFIQSFFFSRASWTQVKSKGSSSPSMLPPLANVRRTSGPEQRSRSSVPCRKSFPLSGSGSQLTLHLVERCSRRLASRAAKSSRTRRVEGSGDLSEASSTHLSTSVRPLASMRPTRRDGYLTSSFFLSVGGSQVAQVADAVAYRTQRGPDRRGELRGGDALNPGHESTDHL